MAATSAAAPSLTLIGVRPDNPYAGPGGTVTLDYSVDNETGLSQDVRLGATVYSDQILQNTFSDEANDLVVTTYPGVHLYTRPFFFPEAAQGQSFDLLVSITDPSFSVVHGLRRYNHAITVFSGH